MKPLLLSFLLSVTAAAQPAVIKLIELPHASLPFGLRVENSGIYSISSFGLVGNQVLVSAFGTRDVYQIQQDRSFRKMKSTEAASATIGKIPWYADGQEIHLDAQDGSYRGENGTHASVRVNERRSLTFSSTLGGTFREFQMPFAGDLGFADLIGIDARGHVFILVERYLSEIPLKTRREVLTLTSDGTLLSTLEIPDIKYCSTERDFQIDADGNLYHLMTTRESVIVFKWSGLTSAASQPIMYPDEYRYSLHYNDFVSTEEAPGEYSDAPQALVNRATALHIGETYAMHQYTCTSSNLAPAVVTAPDGDLVQTPPWLLTGVNSRVPYMWGGFSTLRQFDSCLKAGNYAGDINTAGVSRYAVGVDCSGFVSRCWQLTSHYSTSMMPGISTQYSNWDSLRPGDAILYAGSHVRLFIERTPNGGFRVVESAGRNWDVSYYTFALSDLQAKYIPRCYKNMDTAYSFQRPTLLSVITGTDATAELTWQCDTTNILGYRLYRSTDGMQWTLFQNETTLGRMTQTSFTLTSDAEYYRIASVKNDASKTESDWSNAMGTSRLRGTSHYMIVDGFERLNGSWQGPGNTFAARYGAALKNAGVTFSTMKNSQTLLDTNAVLAYGGLVWFLGDEGTELETFSSAEQSLVRSYLQSGKKLFVTGSEVGYDLSSNGSAADKTFYADYLKAVYKADNAGSTVVQGVSGGIYDGFNFNLGQLYVENSPDEIDAGNGSTVCMRYANGKVGGVQYAGTFGGSSGSSRMVYLSFALETAANDTAFNGMIGKTVNFLENRPNAVVPTSNAVPVQFALEQNYPNPFNPETTLRFSIPESRHVSIEIFNTLGSQVASPFSKQMMPGTYSIRWNAAELASGVYFAVLKAGDFRAIQKMLLMR
jgi:cell wall-associated NlpC family hydrolase